MVYQSNLTNNLTKIQSSPSANCMNGKSESFFPFSSTGDDGECFAFHNYNFGSGPNRLFGSVVEHFCGK